MICKEELCFNSTDLCKPPPEDCEHMQIANEGAECLFSKINKVCVDGEYCDLLADDCLDITAALSCPAYPETADEICNCEDSFACKPGYMCTEGTCIERPDPCPARPYVNTREEACWCSAASDFCASGQMCDSQCSDPPPDCAQSPLAPADGSCVCSWPKEEALTAKVRRVLTGELVGRWDGIIIIIIIIIRWDGNMMTPEDKDQAPLSLTLTSTIMEGTEEFGYIEGTMIYKKKPESDWVRLSEYPKGRIELFQDGKWSTLCSHYW